MRVLLAFDKYKGSLSAAQACAIAATAIAELDAEVEVLQRPLSDGGEGFCEIVTTALGGEFRDYRVTYPDLRSGSAQVGYVDLATLSPSLRVRLQLPERGLLAILEMAQAAGHHQVPNATRNPWNYSTAGVGELLYYATGEGAGFALLGMGGSATHDMGIGLLEAWGLSARDAGGNRISPLIPANWESIVQLEAPPELPSLQVRLACDVRNPLHGPNGAAAVFGPQKGLLSDDLPRMQEQMEAVSGLLARTPGLRTVDPIAEGMGAAGGLPFGISLAFEATIVPGFELICEILDLEVAIGSADLVFTGEGALDASSLSGKGPYEIVRQCARVGKPVFVLPGKAFPETAAQLTALHPKVKVLQLGDPDASIEANIRNEAAHLKQRVQQAMHTFQPPFLK